MEEAKDMAWMTLWLPDPEDNNKNVVHTISSEDISLKDFLEVEFRSCEHLKPGA